MYVKFSINHPRFTSSSSSSLQIFPGSFFVSQSSSKMEDENDVIDNETVADVGAIVTGCLIILTIIGGVLYARCTEPILIPLILWAFTVATISICIITLVGCYITCIVCPLISAIIVWMLCFIIFGLRYPDVANLIFESAEIKL